MGRSADVEPASGTVSGGSARYRKRRPVPALLLLLVLVVSSVVVWVKVLGEAEDMDAAIKCNAPGGVAPGQEQVLGTALGHDALDRTDLAPVGEIHFRAFNASTQRNQAKFVATSLTEMGAQQAAEPGNDPVYPAQDMACRGQIRFGAPGAEAARTLSVMEPCMELVRDDRQDATVDIAVGKKFTEVKPNNEARKVLDQLAAWAEQQPEQQGGQAAEPSSPQLDADHLAAAREVHC
ncbi:envelope integrity protein Cei [Actinosynnema pretiosum]|uniref:LytR/CpsA/Psr regulator C-terminal domain-containing protein n=1 Tax=Actinosynnema pretiosum TaxID=42197 RepID=A0A290Z2C9_9PSEU|nr:envelope integrity protein Cei [Actinosynnema pretiosum]ATE53154.1 hypothetical protein CNX65_07500 [Actinosynnema pretiosum]